MEVWPQTLITNGLIERNQRVIFGYHCFIPVNHIFIRFLWLIIVFRTWKTNNQMISIVNYIIRSLWLIIVFRTWKTNSQIISIVNYIKLIVISNGNKPKIMLRSICRIVKINKIIILLNYKVLNWVWSFVIKYGHKKGRKLLFHF